MENEKLKTEKTKCPNCKESQPPCKCLRNICMRCGESVGNITFTVCDDCWDIEHPAQWKCRTCKHIWNFEPIRDNKPRTDGEISALNHFLD